MTKINNKKRFNILLTLFFIIIIISFLTPIIAPDKSYFANQQHPELAYLPMGTKVTFLIKKMKAKVFF